MVFLKKKYKKIIEFIGVILLIVITVIIVATALNKGKNSEVDETNLEELKGNISFVSNRTDKGNELRLLINEFEKLHPKVKVDLELIGNAEEILQRKAAVGELPDVTLVPSAINSSEYKNYFLPIDELGFNDDNIYNYSVGVSDDGKLYNLTTSICWQGVIYNKQIFKDANITEMPKTKEEFFKVCEKIKSRGITPIALNYMQPWVMNMWLDVIPYLLDTQLEENMIIKSKDILNNESAVYNSLEFARGIASNGYCEKDLLNYDWQQCKNDIKDGKTAMIVWNSDFQYQLEDMGMSKDDIGMFPIPDSEIINVVGDYRYAVSKNTEETQVSKAFLKFIFEQDRYAKAVNIMSIRKDSHENIGMIKELEQFNVPITIQADITKNQTSQEMDIHNEYYNLRKSIGLNSKFVQEYITSSDTKSIIVDTNEKWKQYKNKK